MNNATKNKIIDRIFNYLGVFCTLIGLVVLAIFLINIVVEGIARIDFDFLTSLPSRKAEKAGILTAWVGTLWIISFTFLIAVPLGICAGIYLEEYGGKSKLASILEVNISNLAGVPSVIYGLLGLEIFVRVFSMGSSVIAGSFTLALLILPIIIVATREALKAIPSTIRAASYALGASKWQTIWNQVLPASFGGILTGVILAISRAVGETAPLIVVGALAYVPFTPKGPMDEFTVLPIQIFNWVSRPQHAFSVNSAAAIIILLLITFAMNGIAVYYRNRWQKKLIGNMENKLEARNVDVFYGDFKALNDINMKINSNAVTALIGPSGCGKSTYLRLFNRMNDYIDTFSMKGEILIDNIDVYNNDQSVEDLRKKIGMVFQKPNPFPKSIFENVAYGLKIQGIKDKNILKERVEKSLKQAALWDEVKSDINKSALALSGGQQQRLCIARALAVEPDILLMDEPTSALDPIATAKVESLISELKQHYTIVIVTHNMQQASRISDFTAFFYMGDLIEFDRTEKIFTKPKQERTQNYITGRFG